MPLLLHADVWDLFRSVTTGPQIQTPGVPTHQTKPKIVSSVTNITLAQLLRTLRVLTKHARSFIPFFVAHPMKSMATQNSQAEVVSTASQLLRQICTKARINFWYGFNTDRTVLLAHHVLKQLLCICRLQKLYETSLTLYLVKPSLVKLSHKISSRNSRLQFYHHQVKILLRTP